MSEQRKGDWMQTWSGVQFWPIDPRPEDIRIIDIAHSLSMQCRFAGHCNRFYSVAEHSVRVSWALPPELQLAGLLHDAAEAYLVDLPRPIKRGSAMGALYKDIEDRIMVCICQRFGLPAELSAEIKRADNILLMTEKRDLMGPAPQEWMETESPLPDFIYPWSHSRAKSAFLHRFEQLTARSTGNDDRGDKALEAELIRAEYAMARAAGGTA